MGIPIPGLYTRVWAYGSGQIRVQSYGYGYNGYTHRLRIFWADHLLAVNLRKAQSHKTRHVNVNRSTLNEILIYLQTVNFFFLLTEKAQ